MAPKRRDERDMPGPKTLGSIVFLMSLVYIYNHPWTKVEESFALQAAHDMIYLNPLSQLVAGADNSTKLWDHVQFPGVVHRTFLNSYVLSVFASPIAWVLGDQRKAMIQSVVRAVLAAFVAWSYAQLTRAVERRMHQGRRIANWMTLIVITQFHYLFYASRTLPNTFALVLVQLILAAWIEKDFPTMTKLIAFCVLVSRFETIILFGLVLAYEVFITRRLHLVKGVLGVGIPAGIAALTLSVPFDSYFWGYLVWPEGDNIRFNLIDNRSHEFGTSPMLWYFYSALPRLLFASVPLLVATRRDARPLLGVALGYVALYSFLPHKETRFIIYVVPLLLICIGSALVRLDDWIDDDDDEEDEKSGKSKKTDDDDDQHRSSSDGPSLWLVWLKILVRLALLGHLLLNLVATSVSIYLAFYNYPGGRAIAYVNAHLGNTPHSTAVYVTDMAAQSGFTRFLELDNVHYNKAATFVADDFVDYKQIYLILETGEHRRYLGLCNRRLQCPLELSPTIRKVCTKIKTIVATKQYGWQGIKIEPALNIFQCNRDLGGGELFH